MHTATRSVLWITLISVLIVNGPPIYGAELANDNKTSQIVSLSVKASFDQGDKKSRYFSYWSGKLLCQCDRSKNNTEALDLSFPVGLGVNPSSLSMRWTTILAKKTESSGPVFISLVKSKTEPSDVMAWTQLKESNDPSLTIPLAASTGKEREYTNEDEVEGKIVAWLKDKKGMICLPLAKVRIPERSILLKYSSDEHGEPSVELTIQSMRIIDFEDDTWMLIIKSGNRHLDLPTDPEDAECKSFKARNDVKLVEGQNSITELQRTFLQAYRAGDIDTSNMKKIIGYVDGYKISEINTDNSQISGNQMQCQKLINGLVKSGKLKSQGTTSILELNKNIFNHKFPSDRFFGRRVPPPTHTASGPEVIYYVRQISGTYVPDGTTARPYRSISQAYDAAKAVDSRRVELVVDEGYYDESLNFDRNTILNVVPGVRPIIASTITCTRAIQLEITGFYLIGAPSPGALQVLVPGSSVSLTDVLIRAANRYGIYQRGGEIQLRAVTVRDTRRETGQMEYGTGILLQDGVQAFMSSVISDGNESSGIILRGRDSYLSGTDVTLWNNKLHTDFYSEAAHNLDLPVGAFLVYDQAVANLTQLRMNENEFSGLGAYNNAEVTVNDAIISYNRSIRLSDSDRTPEDIAAGVTNNWGGFGMRAKNGGHITMRNFLISHCELAGVVVHNLGEIDLHNGQICYNVIGAHIAWSFDVGRLMDAVVCYENEKNLQMEGGPPVPGGIPDMPD